MRCCNYDNIDVISSAYKMSFKSLVCAVSVQCQEIKQALASISYFDTWDSEVVAECCRVSSVAEYPPDTIILGPGTGTSHTVYFILEGVCKMVQNLLIEVKTNPEQKELYKLYRLSNSKIADSKSRNEGYSSRLFNQKQACGEDKIPDNEEQARNGQMESLRETEGKEEPEEAKSGKSDVPQPEAEESHCQTIRDDGALTETFAQTEDKAEIPRKADADEGNAEVKEGKDSTENSKQTLLVQRDSQESDSKTEFVFEPDHHLRILEECKKKGKEATGVCKEAPLPERPKHVECFFVQTGFLHKGACFGLEKCQKESFIMSAAKVKCLKIPRRFLFKHNPRYTWNRIQLFHSLYLPKDEEILERLRTDRMWIRERDRESSEILSSRNIHNYTLINEVPYSTRLTEVLL